MRLQPFLARTLHTVLIAVLTILVSCAQPAAIGGPCQLGIPASAGTVTLSSPALECEGRVCMQIGGADAVCTAECRTDDDCQTVAAPGASACPRGFACAVLAPVGRYACHHLCVCRADLPGTVSCAAGS